MLVTAISATAADATIPAVWREQHFDFYYMGRTSRYSCEGLQDKVRAMLLDLGARRDLKVTAFGCDDAGQVAKSMNHALSITLSAPAPADAALKPLPAGEATSMQARYEPFTIASDAFRNMGMGDCELVEEFSHQILPRLVTRQVKQDITCVPNAASGSRFLVRGEVLKTLPSGAP